MSWKAPLSRDLGVALRTVERWAAGEFNMPESIAVDLAKLLEGRKGEAERLITLLTAER